MRKFAESTSESTRQTREQRPVSKRDIAAYIRLCFKAKISKAEVRASLRRMGLSHSLIDQSMRQITRQVARNEETSSLELETLNPVDTLEPLHGPVQSFRPKRIRGIFHTAQPVELDEFPTRSSRRGRASESELLLRWDPRELGQTVEFPGLIQSFIMSIPYFAIIAFMGMSLFQAALPEVRDWFGRVPPVVAQAPQMQQDAAEFAVPVAPILKRRPPTASRSGGYKVRARKAVTRKAVSYRTVRR